MRVFGNIFKLNAMLMGALDDLVNNENDLIQKIKAFQLAHRSETVSY